MFNIVEKRKLFYIISAVLILIGIVSMAFRGFNQDIEFIGGTTMYIDMEQTFDNNELRSVVTEAIGFAPSSIQKTGDHNTEAIVKTVEIDSETRDKMYSAVKEAFSLTAELPLSVENVGAAIGAELKRNAVLATILAVILMLIYISFRFELMSGLAAVIALIHDILIMFAIYSLFALPINTSFIAAILTILGYSINATIILFDRIRENSKIARKETFSAIVNNSVWQTMGRSINTSLTTLIMVAVLFILGVPSIKEFAFPIIVGVIAGTYSSVFLSGNIWRELKKMRNDKNVA